METEKQAINRINSLTQEQRDAAYNAARNRIAGAQPQRESSTPDSRFPKWVSQSVTGLCFAMLCVAFLPSAMRLNAIAIHTNAEIMQHATSVYVAAIATVAMAEIGQIIFSLAAAINDARWQKYLLSFGALICTLIALSGNANAMGTHAFENLFAFLDTFAPPVLVLIAAQILKTQMLHATEATHANKRSFESATQAWNAAYANAHLTQEWSDVLANCLRDALRAANKQSKVVLRDLTNADWRALVINERNAEEWYKVATQEAQNAEAQRIADAERLRLESERNEQRIALEEQTRLRLMDSGASTGTTGEVANARLIRKGSAFVRECPECKKKFEGDTERKATNKLVAHMRVHVRERRAFALTNVPSTEEDTEPVAQPA